MDQPPAQYRIRKRRRVHRRHWKSRLSCVALGLVPLAAMLLLSSLGRRRHLPFASDDSRMPAHSEARPVYPYSIIRGGAYSPAELISAADRDPVVAAHYAGFPARRARIVRLREDKQAYVSFRLGSRIYWTNHRVRLHAGEQVLSDGLHLARARCGNRVSDVPLQPTAPREPDAAVWDTPENEAVLSEEAEGETPPPPAAGTASEVSSPVLLPAAVRSGGSTPPFWYSSPASMFSLLVRPRPAAPPPASAPPYIAGITATVPSFTASGPEPPPLIFKPLPLRPGPPQVHWSSRQQDVSAPEPATIWTAALAAAILFSSRGRRRIQ